MSRITEQALSSIVDYLETQNKETSSDFLALVLFKKKVETGPPGIEPGTPGSLCNASLLKSPVLYPY
jgi:hypothetical protein